jgi:acetaldehyde dehydrogenase (acetylating)
MGGQYIIVSSITYAYKGKAALERKNIRVNIEKAPKNLSDCGCHYALKILNASLSRAIEVLNKERVRIIASGGAGDDLS